jgi:predicted O-methyltransferase YrrM
MIDLNVTNEWQHRDPSTGLVLPWYTKYFLDELATWDLSDKVVFEYGAGASTVWWAKKARKVYGVESNVDYHAAVTGILGHTAVIMLPNVNDRETYVNAIKYSSEQFDIIIIDGEPIEWRDDCVQPALNCLKPGGKLIIDNWDQPSVWVPSDETREMITALPHVIYPQVGHPDWKTLVATKP